MGPKEEGILMIEELTRELTSRHLHYEVYSHEPTMTAREEAAELRIPRPQVAKTLVVATPGGRARVVLPASERLDLHKVGEVVGGGTTVRLASESELAVAYPMFELGAVPPFGGPPGDRSIVDRRLVELESIVVEAGSHTESVRIRPTDLVAITKGEIADICAD